ncbi:hypothetical protein KM043_007945 [Ampulex compressa]|nr:hypothetical protein KM043_007945 [Ampulex compressa]
MYTIDNTSDFKKLEYHERMCSAISFEEDVSLQQTVLMHLSQRLGRSWRDVARHLNIRECEIDTVQNKYPYDLKEQCNEILKNYFMQCKTGSWKIDLLLALEKGRRKDLKEMVQQLFFSTN